jgi:hypothetical protein
LGCPCGAQSWKLKDNVAVSPMLIVSLSNEASNLGAAEAVARRRLKAKG